MQVNPSCSFTSSREVEPSRLGAQKPAARFWTILNRKYRMHVECSGGRAYLPTMGGKKMQLTIKHTLLVGTRTNERRDLAGVFADLESNGHPTVVSGATFTDAPVYIRRRRRLRFVIVTNEQQVDAQQMRQACMRLAPVISNHPCKPAVIFVAGTQTMSLIEVFRGLHVRIWQDTLSDGTRDYCPSLCAAQFD